MNNNRYTLGIHLGHDRGASIVRDGIIFAHIAQDRLDRIKHSEFPLIPFDAVNALFKQCKITLKNISAVGVSFADSNIENFLPEIKDDFCSYYKFKNMDFFGVSHHLAHALSTFYTSNFNNSLIFVCDGAGEKVNDMFESESVFIAENRHVSFLERRLQPLSEVWGKPYLYLYPVMEEKTRIKEISLGLKYEQFTFLLGFNLNQDGKTMGLASYGKSLINFDKYSFNGLDFSLKYEDLFKEIHSKKIESGLTYRNFIKRERANIAATVQGFLEYATLSILEALQKKYKCENLCLAGGVFLNCLTNHKLIEKKLFKRIHIIPTAGDDGQSIGAAFYAYKNVFDLPKSTSVPLPWLGLSYSPQHIRKILNDFKLKFHELRDSEIVKLLAMKISEGKVIAILRGRSEMGPRALCHRSILVDPRFDMKQYLNKYVKFREAFRPYAPVVTWEDQFRYFDLKEDSPYMLLAAKVKPEYRKKIRAVTHVDKTARVQSIRKEEELFIHRLLKEFEKITGFPILLNTSFNLAGDPMVESPYDAILTFLKTKIDILVIENYLVDKSEIT